MCRKAPFGRCQNSLKKSLEKARVALDEAQAELDANPTDESYVNLIAKEQDYLKALMLASNSSVDIPDEHAEFSAHAGDWLKGARNSAGKIFTNFSEHPLAKEDSKYARVVEDLGADLDTLVEADTFYRVSNLQPYQNKHHFTAATELVMAGSKVGKKISYLRAKQQEWMTENYGPVVVPDSFEEGYLVEETNDDGTVSYSGMPEIYVENEYVKGKVANLIDQAKQSEGRIKVFKVSTEAYEMGSKVKLPDDWQEPAKGFWNAPEDGEYGYAEFQDNGEKRGQTFLNVEKEKHDEVVASVRQAGKVWRGFKLLNQPGTDEVYNLHAERWNNMVVPIRVRRRETRELIS